MKQMPQKPVERPAGSRQRVAAQARKSSQQKKLAIVFLLFFVMAVLWVRMFVLKGTPKTAKADPNVRTAAAPAIPEVKEEIVYTELPVVEGRQDVIANDLFSARNYKGFIKIGETTAENEPDAANENNLGGELAAAVAQMELSAIVKDKKPQAFIEDNLVEPGQSFKFVFHDKVYNFKVVNILEDRVELECNGTIVVKKIPESVFKEEQ